jgi:hypothetical protein
VDMIAIYKEVAVSVSVLYMSMSLDGYIAGPNDEVGNPGGDGFMRLHEWFGDFSRPEGPVGELFDEMNAYGAIVVGRRTAEQIDHWGGAGCGGKLCHAVSAAALGGAPRTKYRGAGCEGTRVTRNLGGGDRARIWLDRRWPRRHHARRLRSDGYMTAEQLNPVQATALHRR